MAIPDRWVNYTPIGESIPGTRFIAFKVPLRENVIQRVSKERQLSMQGLLKKIPNLGLIIDLTNTRRYYDNEFFVQKGIKHVQINVPGHHVPQNQLIDKFKIAVFSFLNKNTDNEKLIGVHCTHGVNRTGFMICHFMISEMKMKPSDAIEKFGKARGHEIERRNYIEALYGLCGLEAPKKTESQLRLGEKFDSRQSSIADFQAPSPFAKNPLDNWRLRAPSPNFRLYNQLYISNNTEESNYWHDRQKAQNNRKGRSKSRDRSPHKKFEPEQKEAPLSWRDKSRQDQGPSRNWNSPRHYTEERSRVRWNGSEREQSSTWRRGNDREQNNSSNRSRPRKGEENRQATNRRSIQLVRSWPEDPYK